VTKQSKAKIPEITIMLVQSHIVLNELLLSILPAPRKIGWISRSKKVILPLLTCSLYTPSKLPNIFSSIGCLMLSIGLRQYRVSPESAAAFPAEVIKALTD
jgi:hypothetical protein